MVELYENFGSFCLHSKIFKNAEADIIKLSMLCLFYCFILLSLCKPHASCLEHGSVVIFLMEECLLSMPVSLKDKLLFLLPLENDC